MYALSEGVRFKAHRQSEYFPIVLHHLSNNPTECRLIIVISFQKRGQMPWDLRYSPEFLFYLVRHGKCEIPGLYFGLVEDNLPGIIVAVTQDEGKNERGATQHQERHLECDATRKP